MNKILIIEDDIFYRQRLSEILQDYGFSTTGVSSCEDALRINLDEIIAAIIDVMLPNNPQLSGINRAETRGDFMSGVALARKIRTLHNDFPIVLFSAEIAGDEARNWAADQGIPYIIKSDGPKSIIDALCNYGILKKTVPQSFIVHGHDERNLLELKNYIQNILRWKEPIILREQPGSGKTIIEKIEDFSLKLDYIFVLLTPDDIVFDQYSSDERKRRARQNVIFELGFFYGLYGRSSGKIIVLHKGPIEIPSDINGIIYIDIQNGIMAAGENIRKELVFE